MKKAILWIMLSVSIQSPGQIVYFRVWQAWIDKMESVVRHSEGRVRVDALNELSRYIVLLDPAKSRKYALQAKEFAKVIDYPEGLGAAYVNTGNSYYYIDDKISALAQYYSALPLLEPTEPSKNFGILLYYLALLNSYLMNYDKADIFFQRSLSNMQMAGDSASIIDIYHYMYPDYFRRNSSIENSQGSPEKEPLFTRNEVELKFYSRHPEFNWGGYQVIYCLFRRGDMYRIRKDHRALEAYREALELSLKQGDPYTINWAYGAIGIYYSEVTGDNDTALVCFRKALGDVRNLASARECGAQMCANISDIYIKRKEYHEALNYLMIAHNYLTSAMKEKPFQDANLFAQLFFMNEMKTLKVEIDSMISCVCTDLGDLRSGMKYQKEYYDGKNSVLRDQTNLRVSLMQGDLEIREAQNRADLFAKESKLKEVRLSRIRLITAGSALLGVVLVLLLLSWFRRKRLQSEQKSLILEQKLLRSQMNPHFIFNSLASIQNFIVNQNPGQATIYLSRFSKLIRSILDNSVEEYIPLEKEIETIRNYLELQKIRYGGQFDFSVQIDPSLDIEYILIPPMLAQPFIENSIEHGLKHRETPGHLDVRFSMEGNIVRFIVQDDGVGRATAYEIEKNQKIQHRSMATSITKERLKILNRKLHTRVRFEIEDLKDAIGNTCGTRVTFGIPWIAK